MTEVATAPHVQAIEISGEPTALYRFYDAADTLLYVGISGNPAVRWTDHAAEKSWWPQVVRKTIVMYGSRMEAEIAEGIAIRSESPLHNIARGRRDPSKIPPRKPAAPRKPATARKTAATLGPPRRLPPSPDAWYHLGPYQHFIHDYAEREGSSDVEAAGRLLFAGIMEDYLRRFEDYREALDTLKADCDLHMKPTAAKGR